MDLNNSPRIFVIGFAGSDRKSAAEKLAKELEYQIIDLDLEIEKADGRSIQRICMMMGEHEYRNKEYEMLEKIKNRENIVVICGDGIVLDDMNRQILEQNSVVVADAEKSAQELWENALRNQEQSPYAFMHQSDNQQKKEKFMDLYEQRKSLYNQFR